MKKFLIAALAEIIGAPIEWDTSHESRATGHTSCFTGVSTDSRTIKAGDCFFAIAGENFDGADFLSDAFAKGAVCAVVSMDSCLRRNDSTQYAIRNTQYAILWVDDTVKALGDFAGEYRRQMNFKVVAITGSVGKTMTRQIAYHVLSQHFRVFAAPKNFNNNIGLPLTLLGADAEDKIVITEIGSNHPGEIAYLTRIAAPDIAVVTNVYPAHLAGFSDLETIIQEKLSISEGLQPHGVFIINADTVARDSWPVARVITFGKSGNCDIQTRDITHSGFGSRFTINGTQIHLPLPGPGNVENALAAWSICSRFGLTIDDFAEAVKTMLPVSMRAELLQIGTLTVLNDCYNANPASMKNALDILASLDSGKKRRLVFICGDMAELGEQSERLHAELGAAVARAGVRLLLAVGKFAGITAEAAKGAAEYNLGFRKAGALQTKCFKNTVSACNNLQEFIKDYDIILVKGSRVARLEMTIEKLKEHFS